MILIFLMTGILAGVSGMVLATFLGFGLGVILAAYPVFGAAGFCLGVGLSLFTRKETAVSSTA